MSAIVGLQNDAVKCVLGSRHVGFQIVMQISHVLCWGANIGIKANCGNSGRRNIELINNFISFDCLRHFDFLLRYLLILSVKKIAVTCASILFYYLGNKHSMNMKQIICVAKMFVITSRTCVVCPLRSV